MEYKYKAHIMNMLISGRIYNMKFRRWKFLTFITIPINSERICATRKVVKVNMKRLIKLATLNSTGNLLFFSSCARWSFSSSNCNLSSCNLKVSLFASSIRDSASFDLVVASASLVSILAKSSIWWFVSFSLVRNWKGDISEGHVALKIGPYYRQSDEGGPVFRSGGFCGF